jgi:hypothetical protein
MGSEASGYFVESVELESSLEAEYGLTGVGFQRKFVPDFDGIHTWLIQLKMVIRILMQFL